MGFFVVSFVVGGLGFLPVVVARNLFARCVFGVFATIAAGIAIAICVLVPNDGIGLLGYIMPFLMLWALSSLLFITGLFVLWLNSIGERAVHAAGPKPGNTARLCPTCGTPYRCDDYREGVESHCVVCHTLLEC
jgi:hypothetical protein